MIAGFGHSLVSKHEEIKVFSSFPKAFHEKIYFLIYFWNWLITRLCSEGKYFSNHCQCANNFSGAQRKQIVYLYVTSPKVIYRSFLMKYMNQVLFFISKTYLLNCAGNSAKYLVWTEMSQLSRMAIENIRNSKWIENTYFRKSPNWLLNEAVQTL